MQKPTAATVSAMFLDITAQLDDSVGLVQSTSPTKEFEVCRAASGEILGTILLEILNPLYLEHPELKPPQLT